MEVYCFPWLLPCLVVHRVFITCPKHSLWASTEDETKNQWSWSVRIDPIIYCVFFFLWRIWTILEWFFLFICLSFLCSCNRELKEAHHTIRTQSDQLTLIFEENQQQKNTIQTYEYLLMTQTKKQEQGQKREK